MKNVESNVEEKMAIKGKKGTTNRLERNCVFIRKVILENFLSFQKDDVDFGDSRFIIIVGPNWSGKTSIFQAIKFGLGSNERDERYSKWSDFIRTGRNHAMVEIHIQNGDELIRIRRIVIRGKSPFFMLQRKNDKNFRKTQVIEVQKLVSGLNINPDNQFAYVSQGKIDKIKSLKPIELCSFLEEGIGLKGLRDEILQQKNNVLSLNSDLMSLRTKKNTLNFSLDLLRPKLERLTQKIELLKIKKKFTDELLWANRNKLQQEIEKLDYDIVLIQADINQIKRKKNDCDRKIESIQEKIKEIEQMINSHSEKLGELNYINKDLVSKIQDWQIDKIKMKQELDDLAEIIATNEKVLENFEKQKESLEKELKIIKEEKLHVELQIDDLIKEQSELTKKIKLNEEFLDKYNQLITKKKELKTSLQENNKIIKETNNQINEIFQSFKDINHKLDKNKWFLENPSKDLLKHLDKDIREATIKGYDIESEIKQIEIEKSKKLKRLKSLQISLRERRIVLPSNITILKDEIRKRELKVKGPIIEFLKYDDDLSYAIESVLGEKVLYSFIADNWDTLNLLKRLKNKYNAYCNIYVTKNLKIVPLNKINANGVIGYLAELIRVLGNDLDIKKVIHSISKNCLVVKDYRVGKELHRNRNFKGKCVTLKGEQIISYKYVFETPYLKRLKGLLSVGTQSEQANVLEIEIKALNDRISELKVNQSKFDNLQREAFRKKEAFNDLLYNFNQKQRLTSKKNQLYESIHILEKKNTTTQNTIKELNREIKNLEAQKDPEFFKWNERIKEIPKELNFFNTEKKKWDAKSLESQEHLREVEEKTNNHENKLNIINLEYQTKRDNFQKADKEAFNIFRTLQEIEEEIDLVKESMVKSKSIKSEFQNEKSDREKKNIQIKLNLEQKNIKINSLKQDLDSKKRDLDRINSEMKPLISQHEIEVRTIEEINEDITKIDKELLKYLDVDDELLVERDQILVSLKKIAKNQANMEKDIKAALKTENKMEDTYNNKFKVVLNDLKAKINNKFKSSQIKSYCSLELIGNFEELGIEIKAATSKDKLKSCSALSGGQVAMISICLILSLQEIKPSPLCMLDEPVMFLDDKNSEIVYQLIKSTLEQNSSQIIMFLPKSSSGLFLLAEKLIGIARVGKKEISSVFEPKIIKIED